jgi:flavin prenyltransferase
MSSAITLAITGGSGTIYALRLLEQLIAADRQVYLLISQAAHVVLATESDLHLPSGSRAQEALLAQRFAARSDQLRIFGRQQWLAPVASGSNAPAAMVVAPCSMGTVAAIAHGTSDSLIERAADVMIKERRPLILVPRETPLSPIHLQNMLTLARIGVTILPASPGFYHRPRQIADLVDSVVARILDHLAISHTLSARWGAEGADYD